jgi:hypothetical protein
VNAGYSFASVLLSLQSQFINQHVKASIIQRNAPTNMWSWEFAVEARTCSRALFGGWLAANGGFSYTQKLAYAF